MSSKTRKSWMTALRIVLISWCLSPMTVAQADEVYLKKGDRILGEITEMEEGTLTIEISYEEDSADLKIDWDKVDRVVFENPRKIQVRAEGVTDDGEHFYEMIDMEVNTLGGPDDIPISRVETIGIKKIRYKGNFELGGNRTSGNTNTSAVNLSLDGEVKTLRHLGSLEAKLNRGTAEGQQTVNNSRLTLGYGYKLTQTWFVGAIQIMEADEFQDLDLRSTTALGGGRQFFDTNRHTLRGFIGPAYVYQKFTSQSATTTPGGTAKLVWSYFPIPDDVEVFHNSLVTQDFTGDRAIRWNADTGIRTSLWSDFYLNVEFQYRFNSEPDTGKQQSDEALIFGIGYEVSN